MSQTKNTFKRMMHLSLLASLGFAALLLVSAPALAQVLGDAYSFAVLGGSEVTAGGGGAAITGDVGVAPGTSITGPVNVALPFANHGNDSFAIAARAAWVPLNNSLLAGACTALSSDQLNGQTLGPGCWSGGALDLASGGTLNLTGSGIYIFRAASSLVTGTGSNVNLDGVDPCNVFWQVTTLATLDGTIPGTVVASDGIHLGTGAMLTGRALAGVPGNVTMAGGNTVGGCSAAVLPPTTLSRPGPLPGGTVGAPISDTKTLSSSDGTSPTGEITFRLYAPNDTDCTGAWLSQSIRTVTGIGDYSSDPYTPLTAGTYRWIATYSGDGSNAPSATLCRDPNESVIVTAQVTPGPTAVPTLNEWGVIIFMLLVGLMSIYYLRRQRQKAKA